MGCMAQSSPCTVNYWDEAEVMAGPPVLWGGKMRSYWSFLILPCPTVSDSRICFCLKPLSPAAVSVSCLSVTALLSPTQPSAVSEWEASQPGCSSSASAWFSDIVFRDVTHVLFFFYCRLVYCVCILVQNYKCFCWFGKKKSIDSLKNFTHKRCPCFNTRPLPNQEWDPQPTLVWAHVKDSSYVGAVFTGSVKILSGKGAGAANGVFPFTDKVTWLLQFLADDT